MKKHVLFPLGIYALVFLLLGCRSETPERLYSEAQQAASDSTTFAQAERLFQRILDKFPDSNLCDDALFGLAQIAMNRGNSAGAVERYHELVTRYPQSDLAHKAQFMIGFIYSEILRDYDKAREAYQRVIDNYPESELVSSAKWMIENMGRNLEELGIFQEGRSEERRERGEN